LCRGDAVLVLRSKMDGTREETGMPVKGKRKGRKRKAKDKVLVDKAIQSIGSKIETNEVKGTLGDFLRLLEYKKQMQEDEPRDIVVTWRDEKPSE
jgi:hypothetical protein